MNIYLSSTYEDLQVYRRTVVEALRKGGYQVIAMEDYVASDQRPVEKCLKDVEDTDLYIGLFAFRYGYIPPSNHQNPNGWSITELEFRRAEELGKPCLTFIVDDATPWPRAFDDAYTGEVKGDYIKHLRHYLRTEKLASTFSSPHELSSLVLAAVTKHLEIVKNPESAGTQEKDVKHTVIWDIKAKGSPYPGLMHFTRKYAPVFAGRDLEIREILDRLFSQNVHFILISGNSGVGKSSVIDAGVLPRIEENPIPGFESCLCLRMLPSQGNHPFSALMGALHPYATQAGLKPEEIADELTESPEMFPTYIRKILSDGTNHDGLVLFIDQMEELFTVHDIKESNNFLKSLFQALNENLICVLATIRSDYLHYCHNHSDLLKILRGPGHYPLGHVEPFMLSDMIVKPAQLSDLLVNERLTRRIVSDMTFESGNLPLLGFVLNQLFELRLDNSLSEVAYKKMGGITGAIAQHAESVEGTIRREQGPKSFELLSKLFQSLVILNLEGLPTRRRPLISEFSHEMKKLINLLVEVRLLQIEGESKEATVSLSHEKLFDAWPSLTEYVASNKKKLVDQSLLESRARKWEEMDKPWFSGLASSREQKDFGRAGVHTALTTEYLNTSRRAKWLQRGLIFLIILSSGLIIQLWKEGLTLEHSILKVKSKFMNVHLKPDMVRIPAGTLFPAKTPDLSNRGKPSHQPVTLKEFAIGRYEVTFQEYDRFAIATGRPLPPSLTGKRGLQPVVNVTWADTNAYAMWLSKETMKQYRLPTEIEWEYAARSGGKTEIWAGTSNEGQLTDYAVYMRNAKKGPEPVGQKTPNGLEIYDMSGNVWEWVSDCYQLDNGECTKRGIRGGSYRNHSINLRSSNRRRGVANRAVFNYGFRLAQDIN